jgi:hypothetical protein
MRLILSPPQPSALDPLELLEPVPDTMLERVVYNGDPQMLANFVCQVC